MLVSQVIKMPGGCEHVCCEACAVNYFTATVRERPLVDATCPFCQEPSDLGANEAAAVTASVAIVTTVAVTPFYCWRRFCRRC